MFLVVGERDLPGWLDRSASMVGPAAVAALVGAMLLTSDGRIEAVPLSHLAAVGGGFVAVRVRGTSWPRSRGARGCPRSGC